MLSPGSRKLINADGNVDARGHEESVLDGVDEWWFVSCAASLLTASWSDGALFPEYADLYE